MAWPQPRRDHPRIRGEHYGHLSVLRDNVGSSPHTRGARSSVCIGYQTLRIIPAYAGSTSTRAPPTASPRDHPRIRGEHVSPACIRATASGSSPHTRGARPGRRSPGPAGRIIPAYAGSTIPVSRGTRAPEDHPRIRGEHGGEDPGGAAASGSSPHTRGAPGEDFLSHLMYRIIPAYAGSTPGRARS